MHELSIAVEILEIVAREAARHQARKVTQVGMRVGDLSGVEVDSLTFSFDAIKGERELTRDAVLSVERLPVRVRCGPCAEEHEAPGTTLVCPRCGGFETRILQGEELEIGEIEID